MARTAVGPHLWKAVGVVLIIAMRVVALGQFPSIAPDEGGWPLAVRLWLGGTTTEDYYMAPGYHWLLGAPFQLFGAQHAVGRMVSAVWGLAGLALFFQLILRLAGRRAAWWSTLLLGTSFSAIMVDRRALMEPFQVTLMLALTLCVVSGFGQRWPGRLLTVGLAALLLLTKASAAFLFPALVLAALWPGPIRRTWRVAAQRLIPLAAGVLVAAAVFGWLYSSNPVMFVKGWTEDMHLANQPGVAAAGSRFALTPIPAEQTLRFFGTLEPLLVGLAAAGVCRALASAQQSLMLSWLILGGVFLSIQVYVQANHRAVLIAPLCFFAGWMLSESEATAERRMWRRWPITWPRLCLALLVSYSAVKTAGALHLQRDGESAAVAWLAPRVKAEATVVAAPHMLMRLGPARVVSFFDLPDPWVPSPAALARQATNWIVIDDREWLYHMKQAGASEAQIEAALQQCCDLAFTAPAARVYRVRPRSGAAVAAALSGPAPGAPALRPSPSHQSGK